MQSEIRFVGRSGRGGDSDEDEFVRVDGQEEDDFEFGKISRVDS